jgi:hypothetical protein
MTAAMLLDALSPNFLEAQQVAPDDTRVETEYLGYVMALTVFIGFAPSVLREVAGPLMSLASPCEASGLRVCGRG